MWTEIVRFLGVLTTTTGRRRGARNVGPLARASDREIDGGALQESELFRRKSPPETMLLMGAKNGLDLVPLKEVLHSLPSMILHLTLLSPPVLAKPLHEHVNLATSFSFALDAEFMSAA